MGQLSTLLGKNWLLYKHQIFGNIFEIVAPIFLICFVAIAYVFNERTYYQEQSFINDPLFSANLTIYGSSSAFVPYHLLHLDHARVLLLGLLPQETV
jgi:hypothetical protein